jgi:hypothetical protein
VYDNFASHGDIVVSKLQSFAIHTHELFTELVKAGFNEEQAIAITVGLATKE